jgi:prefoldin subunit 5
LKLKIDNIIIDNKKLEKENENLNNKLNEIITKFDDYKIDSSNYLQKLDYLKLENKKIDIELLNLNNEYNKLKEEKEKLKSTVDEQNILIYNYQKELNSKTFNLDKGRYKLDRYNITNNDNIYNNKIDNLNEYDDMNYKYSNEDNKNNFFYKKREDINYNDIDDSKGSKYNYYMTNDSLVNTNKTDKKIKKGELNYLENYMNSLLKERIKLENELNEIANYPQTLSNIKSRNNIKDKILLNNNEILNIKKKLQKLRGY